MQAPPTLAFDVVAGLSFKVLKKSPVTAEVSTKSAKCGNVAKGAEVTALESFEAPSGALRIKIDRGWVTARKPDGSKNMEVAIVRGIIKIKNRVKRVLIVQRHARLASLVDGGVTSFGLCEGSGRTRVRSQIATARGSGPSTSPCWRPAEALARPQSV